MSIIAHSHQRVCERPASEGHHVLRVKEDGLIEVLDCPLQLAQGTVCPTPVVIGDGQLRVKLDGFVEVFHGLLELPQVGVGGTPVIVGKGNSGSRPMAWA